MSEGLDKLPRADILDATSARLHAQSVAHGTTAARFVEIRGPSGRLYGRIDFSRMVFEGKRSGCPPELIDLKPYF